MDRNSVGDSELESVKRAEEIFYWRLSETIVDWTNETEEQLIDATGRE